MWFLSLMQYLLAHNSLVSMDLARAEGRDFLELYSDSSKHEILNKELSPDIREIPFVRKQYGKPI
jgi:hypothetical protein